MTERVEEIISVIENELDLNDGPLMAAWRDLLTALAQAEREREEARLFGGQQAAKVIGLRAEVGRLTEACEKTDTEYHMMRGKWCGEMTRREETEATLARVRGALEKAASRLDDAANLMLDVADVEVTHEMANEARAALEGRG